jgi:hypothetical protein
MITPNNQTQGPEPTTAEGITSTIDNEKMTNSKSRSIKKNRTLMSFQCPALEKY